MTPGEINQIRKMGCAASQIASLSRYLSEALGADPDTVVAAQAVEGLETLATRLSDDLLTLVD